QVQSRWHDLLSEHAQASAELRQTDKWDDHVLKELVTGLGPTEIMGADVAASRALDASLMSYLTTAWTIIETMCGDLWEAAINAHPDTLANLSGRATRLKSGRNESPNNLSPRGDSKSVPLDLIAIHQFDVRNKMGTILRSRFEFSRLDIIREAYA